MDSIFISFIVSAFVLFVAQKVGWISLGADLPVLVQNHLWNQLVWLGVISAVFTATKYIAARLYGMLTLATCFLGCFAMPLFILLIGYVQLYAVTFVLPGFSYTHVWWQVFLLSLFVGLYVQTESSSKGKKKNGGFKIKFEKPVTKKKPKAAPPDLGQPVRGSGWQPKLEKPVTKKKPKAAPPDLGEPVRGRGWETNDDAVIQYLKQKEKESENF